MTDPVESPQPPKPPEPGMEIRKPDLQLLLQDLASSQRTLFQERRDAERRLAEERERSRWEQERVRTELAEHLREAERQNDALVRALGRLNEENERLRTEIALLRAKSNGAPAAHPEEAAAPPPPGSKTPGRPPVMGTPQVIAPPQFPLGGTPIRLAEPPGRPPEP